MEPRPRTLPQQDPPQQRNYATPQVAMLLDRSVMDKFNPEFKHFLEEMFGCFIFKDFCKFQIAKVTEDLRSLNDREDWSQDDYFQILKDMRLVLRFWTDLLRFAEEFQPNE